jgi:hypothetical protein
MPNPFPGINPYIEAQGYWPDFHSKFLNYLQEAVGDRLPDAYEARLDERVQLSSGDPDTPGRLVRPDLALTHRPGRAAAPGATALLEPETIPTLIADDERVPFLKILHRPDRTLVTIVELLSPANKTEPDRRDYIARRNAILRQPVHLVELDFLKAGHRLPLRRPPRPADFHALVGRHETRPDSLVYSWSLRDCLPVLPIPLLAPDPDLPIPLADVYATAFDRGRYARSIDRSQPLPTPWADDDRSWAAAL